MIAPAKKERAPRNRTIELTAPEIEIYRKRLIRSKVDLTDCRNKIICGDAFQALKKLPEKTFDLLFADPPYNLTKNFGENSFRQTSLDDYEAWLDSWLKETVRLLKPTASVYICGDWRSSSAIQRGGLKYFRLQNRITWEREKGRGANKNWKNSSEDVWFLQFPMITFSTRKPLKSNAKSSRPIRKTASRRIGKNPRAEISA